MLSIALNLAKPHEVIDVPTASQPYVIIETLGHGNSAVVYKARGQTYGKLHALKLFAPESDSPLQTDDDVQAQFELETNMLLGMAHTGSPYVTR